MAFVSSSPSETVLQPVGPKKKKTVNTPSVKDLKNTDNYMVTHQEEDSKGEVETRIYKVSPYLPLNLNSQRTG